MHFIVVNVKTEARGTNAPKGFSKHTNSKQRYQTERVYCSFAQDPKDIGSSDSSVIIFM